MSTNIVVTLCMDEVQAALLEYVMRKQPTLFVDKKLDVVRVDGTPLLSSFENVTLHLRGENDKGGS